MPLFLLLFHGNAAAPASARAVPLGLLLYYSALINNSPLMLSGTFAVNPEEG